MAKRTYISFDWAMKKLLRQKDNFEILEGFLSEFLGFDVFIQEILESESNKETQYDKFDRVDILVKSDKNELILIELQYDSEVDYFHRMLYGISKLITQYISEGEPYGIIKKAYSINIVYFSLGQGSGYLYEYRGEFFDMNTQNVLTPSEYQKKKYGIQAVSDIFPKYYIIRVNNFKKNTISNPVEEWLYFLQKSEIPAHFKAKGIEKARVKLEYENMPTPEQKAYQRFIENRRIEFSVKETAAYEGFQDGMEKGIEQGMEKGMEKRNIEIAKNLLQKNVNKEIIMTSTGLSMEEIETLEKEL